MRNKTLSKKCRHSRQSILVAARVKALCLLYPKTIMEGSPSGLIDLPCYTMMGWNITLYRSQDKETALAEWQSGAHGLDWVAPLIQEGRARLLDASGYPSLYLVKADVMLPMLQNEAPDASAVWITGEHDVIDFSLWKGKMTIDRDAIAQCARDEWLLLEVWDES